MRYRPDMEATVARLKALGASVVTTEARLKDDLSACAHLLVLCLNLHGHA
jgi:hypothetical protein